MSVPENLIKASPDHPFSPILGNTEVIDRATSFMLNNFDFPQIGNLKPVIWFGILAMIANILALLTIHYIDKKTDTTQHQSTANSLLVINSLLVLAVIGFALSGYFVIAIVFYFLVMMFKEARNPFYDAWANQNVNSKVRATVFSMCSQVNAVGQIVGGPILGIIAIAISLRISLVAGALFLIPSIYLYYSSGRKQLPSSRLGKL